MQEIEVKILEIDPADLCRKLEALGAQKSFDGEMSAIFFDFPDGSIRNAGDVLRLRAEGDTSVLAYKKHISREGAKVMAEYETVVSEPHSMLEILRALGLSRIAGTRKHRIEYRLGDAHLVIDDYHDELAYIPPFLEIEAPGKDQLSALAQQLGFRPEDCLNWDTYDLVKHYGKA
jgi:adenylate cyclase class 2